MSFMCYVIWTWWISQRHLLVQHLPTSWLSASYPIPFVNKLTVYRTWDLWSRVEGWRDGLVAVAGPSVQNPGRIASLRGTSPACPRRLQGRSPGDCGPPAPPASRPSTACTSENSLCCGPIHLQNRRSYCIFKASTMQVQVWHGLFEHGYFISSKVFSNSNI